MCPDWDRSWRTRKVNSCPLPPPRGSSEGYWILKQAWLTVEFLVIKPELPVEFLVHDAKIMLHGRVLRDILS